MMRHFLAVLASVLLISFSGIAQGKLIKHTVVKGETITQIAQKYKVTPADIYRLNPDSQNGLKPDMVLLVQGSVAAKAKNEEKADVKTVAKTEAKAIGKTEIKNVKDTAAKTHTVAAKETVYGLTKMYAVSEEELLKANPDVAKSGLKVGETIVIPAKGKTAKPDSSLSLKEDKKESKKDDKKESKKDDKKAKEVVFHQVEAKETKYSIAKQYGITVEDLDAANPDIKDGLQIGYRLKIVAGTKKESTRQVVGNEDQKVIAKPEATKTDYVNYDVKPKETLYGLTKKFGMSQAELISLNPELKDGVREGMTLRYPATTTLQEGTDKDMVNLSKKITTQQKKQLVLLLPFNISKIEGDTVNSTASRLKTDKFLNMTLDFYSGALMAIDSAKTLGMNIDVKIYDSQETKNSSAVASIIQQQAVDKADVVIGPFYQTNVEKTADLLSASNVPVISPLSKEAGKLYGNLLQSMPSNELVKTSMMEFIRSKNGNITAVVDPKKLSTKQFLTQNYKEVKLLSLNEKGLLIAENVAKDLVKGKINYVILDSEKTGLILNTLNVLIGLMPDYQIQLVILEKNNTLDFDEIPLAKLAQLKMLYPSLTKDNDTPEAVVFEKTYKEKNKIFPNQYATRGFDVTFDTMLRLSQDKSFTESIETTATEQVENKFEYEKMALGSHVNKGFYILYYDTDLSVKEAN